MKELLKRIFKKKEKENIRDLEEILAERNANEEVEIIEID